MLEPGCAVMVDCRMHLRPVTESDIELLANVVIEATRDQGRLPDDFDETEYRAGFRDWFHQADSDSTSYVVELDARPIGRLRVSRTTESLELNGIQLLPQFQSHGLGTQLIDGLKAEAVMTRLPLRLSVEKDNPRAQSLYTRLGFTVTGETGDEIQLCWQPPAPTHPAPQ